MNFAVNSIKNYFKEIIKPMGLVFGDIGTSPIYTLSIILLLINPTKDNIIGVVSLMIWSLILIVTIEYSWLAMSLSKRGEGGTIVLREILAGYVKSNKMRFLITILSFIGISLLIGDGVITPAISILSAVEGLVLIPGLEKTPLFILIGLAILIAFGLFAFQRKGTDKVSITFGPIVALWLGVLAVTGLVFIVKQPAILNAINPWEGISFLIREGFCGILVLSSVFLTVTGSEALYADMGHLGKEPIRKAWFVAFIALSINYMGQGAFIIENPKVKSVLFEMIYNESSFFYIPFLLLTVLATIIASQAMISGVFSIVFQAINTRVMPLLKISYTSEHLRSQIYIGVVNWFLFIFVVLIMILFQKSENLGHAYGFAVSTTTAITGLLMFIIFFYQKKWFLMAVGIFLFLIDMLFVISNSFKIPDGAYWSIIIAAIPFAFIIIYLIGNKQIYKSLKPIKLTNFLERYIEEYREASKIKGSALFFARDVNFIPPYMLLTMFINDIIYERNIIISIQTLEEPFGVTASFKDDLAEGLSVFEIKAGYMEILDIDKILVENKVESKVIFYGVEEIITENFLYQIYAIIKTLVPSFVQFYHLPPNKLHGVTTRIHMD